MKLNPRTRTRTVIKPLKVTLTDEEILADLQYPAGIARAQEPHSQSKHRAPAR